MKLRQIEAFRAVMVTGSVGRAAISLSVSQPAITRLIVELEDALGFQLFERRPGQALRPTLDAHSLMQEVEKVFHGLDRLMDAGRAIKTMHRGHLKIVGPSFAINSILSQATVELAELHPEVVISLEVRPQEEVLELISSQRQDIGVVIYPFDPPPDLETTPLYTQRIVCVVPKSHAFSKKKSINIEELETQSVVTMSYQSNLHQLIDSELLLRKINPDRRYFTRTHEATCHLVEYGLGVALIASPVAKHIRQWPGLTIVEVEPTLEFRLGVVLSKFAPLNRLVSDYVKILIDLTTD